MVWIDSYEGRINCHSYDYDGHRYGHSYGAVAIAARGLLVSLEGGVFHHFDSAESMMSHGEAWV